jgi:hypothetical protein
LVPRAKITVSALQGSVVRPFSVEDDWRGVRRGAARAVTTWSLSWIAGDERGAERARRGRRKLGMRAVVVFILKWR